MTGTETATGAAEGVTEMTMVEAVNHALHEEMARDGRVMLFGEDVAVNGGVFRATEGLLEAFGPDRVVADLLDSVEVPRGEIPPDPSA